MMQKILDQNKLKEDDVRQSKLYVLAALSVGFKKATKETPPRAEKGAKYSLLVHLFSILTIKVRNVTRDIKQCNKNTLE